MLQRVVEHLIVSISLVKGRVRARILAFRGAAVKEKVFLGAGCKVERPWRVSLGERFVAEDAVYLKIVSDNASLEFGDHVFIGRGTKFDVINKVSVGDHTVIAPDCFITDHNHGVAPESPIDQQPCRAKPVVIGKDVWLGTKVVVVAGVKIGDGAVVGAGAVVTHDVPPMAMVAGVPAKLVRYRHNQATGQDS